MGIYPLESRAPESTTGLLPDIHQQLLDLLMPIRIVGGGGYRTA